MAAACGGSPDPVLPTPGLGASPSAPVTPGTTAAMPGPPSSAFRARVLRVVDGDTVVLSALPVGRLDRRTSGRHARLIGMDTPEVSGGVQCYGREASAFVEERLGGRDVLVDFDLDRVDRYGRALVYLWTTDGTFFNGELVAEGFARPLRIAPNVRYATLFASLEDVARFGRRGLWGSCAVG